MLGDDHLDTLASTYNLALDLSGTGEHEQARALYEDTLARCRRVLGNDHQMTLSCAVVLHIDLRAAGEHEQAYALYADTLTHLTRAWGDDQQNADILVRCHQMLGNDHPMTLFVAHYVAEDLRAAGEYEQARLLDADTLTRCRRVLGDTHRDTLTSAKSLAEDLRGLGEHEQARQLDPPRPHSAG